MPVYLPPRQGVTQSVALAEAYAHATASEVEVVTISIHHPSFVNAAGQPTAIYITNDFAPFVGRLEATAPLNAGELVTFQAVPFKFVRPTESDTAASAQPTIEIENATAEILEHIEHAAGGTTFLKVMVRIYLPSDNSAPHELPVPSFFVKSGNATLERIVFTISFGDLNNRRFPNLDCTRDSNPGLVAG